MLNIDLIFAPFWSPVVPPYGIASLSSFLKEKGYNVRIIDLNVELPQIYKWFKRLLSMPFDLEATIESLSYPFLISMFYDRNDRKKILTELIKNNTLFEGDDLEVVIDWLINNKLKRTVEDKINTWVNNILNDDPHIVGFSTVCTNFPLSLSIAKEIKKQRRDILTVLGGPHVFWYTNEIVKYLPYIDIIVKGEGEQAFLKIIDELKNNPSTQKRILFEPYLKDINDLPQPDFSDFDFGTYIYRAIPISISRGCVYNCRFCHEKRFWKTYRSKKTETIIKEIETDLERYNIDSFLFCDSLINGNKKLLEKICEKIISKEIDIYWSAQASIRNMDKELLKKMSKSGCRCLLYGIESGSQRILNKMNKGTTLYEIEKVLKLTMNMDIWPLTYWLIGFPGETINDIKKTKDFIIKNKKNIGSAVFHRFILSKETYIYNNPQEYGISIEKNQTLNKINHFLWSNNYTIEKGISNKEALKQTINCRKEINFDSGISMYFPLNRELYPLFYKEKMSGKLKDQWYESPNFSSIPD